MFSEVTTVSSPYSEKDAKVIRGTWLISQTMILIQAWIFIKFIFRYIYTTVLGRFFTVDDTNFHERVQRVEMTENDQITEFTRKLQNDRPLHNPVSHSLEGLSDNADVVEEETLSS